MKSRLTRSFLCACALLGVPQAAPAGEAKVLCDFEGDDWRDKLTSRAITIERMWRAE